VENERKEKLPLPRLLKNDEEKNSAPNHYDGPHQSTYLKGEKWNVKRGRNKGGKTSGQGEE